MEPADAVRVVSPPVERQMAEVVANPIINFPSYKDQAYQWCMPLPGQFDKPVFPVCLILLLFKIYASKKPQKGLMFIAYF